MTKDDKELNLGIKNTKKIIRGIIIPFAMVAACLTYLISGFIFASKITDKQLQGWHSFSTFVGWGLSVLIVYAILETIFLFSEKMLLKWNKQLKEEQKKDVGE